MELQGHVDDFKETVAMLIDEISERVDGCAYEMAETEDQIATEISEHSRCGDPDYRFLYREQIKNLIGERDLKYDELQGFIDAMCDALSDMQEAICDALDDLDQLELPEPEDFTVPQSPRRSEGG
jgi:hypothetical protein